MSSQYLGPVFDAYFYAPANKLVAIKLADIADEDGISTIPIDRLARFCCFKSTFRIQQVLLELQADGLLISQNIEDGMVSVKWDLKRLLKLAASEA